jgi:hypothetical protein
MFDKILRTLGLFGRRAILPLALTMVLPVSAANAWCENPAELKAARTFVPASATSDAYYEWRTEGDRRYTRGRPLLIKSGFLIRLWQDGRYEIQGTMGNYIRHRDMSAAVLFRGFYATGHSPIPDWPDMSINNYWAMGKARNRTHPDLRSDRRLGRERALTNAQFQMFADPRYVIGPWIHCDIRRN